jgi:alcohol dehydrogenase
MKPFNFDLPTKIYFGPGKENQVGEIIKNYGFSKIAIHYGMGSVIKSGLLDRVKNSLLKNNIDFVELGGAKPNPELGLVKQLIKLIRKEKCELVLAIGGGSAIDSAKLAAISYYYDGDPFDIVLQKHKPTKGLPVGVILTISAAGSEMSVSSVVTDTKTKTKSGFPSPLNRPLFAIMNPELTYTVSKYQTAVGAVDIMMHTLERYFSPSNDLEFADYLAEAILKSVIEATPIAIKEPNNYHARSLLMMASSWSHNGLTSLGKHFQFPVHQLEHVVSAYYPQVAHGAGLSVLFPAWALYYCKYDIDKFDKFARNIMSSHLENKEENAKMGVLKIKRYFQSIGMPISFKELGIENPNIDWLVDKLTNNGTRVVDHFVKPLDHEVARAIYNSCR